MGIEENVKKSFKLVKEDIQKIWKDIVDLKVKIQINSDNIKALEEKNNITKKQQPKQEDKKKKPKKKRVTVIFVNKRVDKLEGELREEIKQLNNKIKMIRGK